MITDARVLKEGFVPQEVVHRDAEVDGLVAALQPLVDDEDPENTLLHGPSGAGKTCIARHTLEQLEQELLDVRHTYVNCWEQYTRFRVLYRILEGIGKTLDIHRQSTPKDELLHRVRQADSQPYVLILDEVDQLEDQKVLYDLYQMPHITLIMIANREEDVFARMDDRVRSRLMTSRRIGFSPYSLDALTGILQDRAEWGLHPDAVNTAALERIADHAAGDARVAIGILRSAARAAEEQGAEELTADIIDGAVPDAKNAIKDTNLDRLNEHQQVLYNIIAEAGEIAASDLHEQYEEQANEPVAARTRRKYLQKMVHYDIVTAHGEKKGRTYSS